MHWRLWKTWSKRWHMALKGPGKGAPENLWAVVGWYSCDVTTPHSLLCPSSVEGPLTSSLGWWNGTYSQVTHGAKMDFWFMKKNHRGRQVCSGMLDN